jgi:hypothetical protein
MSEKTSWKAAMIVYFFYKYDKKVLKNSTLDVEISYTQFYKFLNFLT